MQKIACVFSFKMSSWVSCQKIVFNLHKAYQGIPNLKLLNFNYSTDSTTVDIFKTAQEIYAENPDQIVIMDHKPHPLPLLKELLPLFTNKKPRITFHVFGDFTLYYPLWDKLKKLLQGFEVDFIVASDRQKHLIDKFLTPPMQSVVCPFPVDKGEFCYTGRLRDPQRKEWGLKQEDIAYVFTGRLSRQKRIHSLLISFNEFLEKTKTSSAHLFLYGSTDHIGDQFLGVWETEGEYFRKIDRIYRSLPASTQKKIHFMGVVPNKDLKAVYQGADYLVNLSVHNDEDYGMSVAEAQCSGLPSILTDWGGLASFYHPSFPEVTNFIPVKIGKDAKLVHYTSVIKAFETTTSQGNTFDRNKISQLALQSFSVEAATSILKKLLGNPANKFESYSPFFNKVLEKFVFGDSLYMTEKKTISKTYKEIYSSYVRNS